MFQLSVKTPRQRCVSACAPLALALLSIAGCSSSSSSRGSASTTAATTSGSNSNTSSNTSPVTSSSTGVANSQWVAGGTVELLTYNVAGLPQGLSSSNPVQNTPQISPKLNAYELVLCQEDFTYHTQLMAQAQHLHQTVPQQVTSITRPMNDGLNRFSDSPFTGHERVTWAACHGLIGSGNDCLASKGYTFARHELAPGVEIDVYNLHADAGGSQGDEDARAQQFAQLAQDIAVRSAGRAVIIGGDTNLKERRARDLTVLNDFIGILGLTEVGRLMNAPDHIDRFLIRDGGGVVFTPTLWRVADEFKDGQGNDLSDHPAIHVTLDWDFYR